MLVLKRTYEDDRTTGVLYAPGRREFPTLELPWEGNRVRRSCISEGFYNLMRDHSGRHRWFRIADPPPPRTAIEMHPIDMRAQVSSQLEGCIGMARDDLLQLLGMLPNGDTLWITSDGDPPPFEESTP